MRAVLILLLCLTAVPVRAQLPDGAVHGQVRSEGTGEPLVSAMVEVLGAGRALSVATDRDGRYRLPSVPVGRRRIRVSHLGHAPLEVEVLVPAGREVALDVALPLRPVELRGVKVDAGGARSSADTSAAPAVALGLANARALETTPGIAELGLADAARGVPGQEPVDPSDVLYVRGAAANLKLVYLDGAPVYSPFPLGGLLETFTPGLLHAADVYLGGAPARYDGGLSYVLDLRTRGVRADAAHSTGAVDMLGARALVEAPLGERAGVLAAGRLVHGLGSLSPLPYRYREGLLRGDVRVGEEGVLSATAFVNGEAVWLDAEELSDSTVRWGNGALSLRYRGTVLGTDAELTAAVGTFEAHLPLEGTRSFLAEGKAQRTRLSADLGRRMHGVYLRYGLSFDRQAQAYRARTDDGSSPEWLEADGDVLGAYADLAWQPLPRVRLRGGMRLDHFSLGPQLTVAPRVSATWLITERAALTLAGGRYHQYLRAPEAALLQATAGGSTARAVAPLALGSASHLAVSVDQDLGEGVRLGVEGFFKRYRGMPGSSASEANASGMDVWVRRTQGSWTGWLGYSLAWVWSPPGTSGNQFAGRHLLSSGLDLPLGDRSQLDLRFAYGAGLPYATIPVAPIGQDGFNRGGLDRPTPELTNSGSDAAPLLPTPDEPYLRLDIGASRTWHPRWLGVEPELRSYVKLLNTLSRRDALFYHYERGRDERPRALASLPLVPVIGAEWRF